jgi:hypothetical protein
MNRFHHIDKLIKEESWRGMTGIPAQTTMIKKYRKKPVEIEALQYTGDNLEEMLNFTGKHPKFDQWFKSLEDYQMHVLNDRMIFKVFTLEGVMEASIGDYIIKGVKGEFYPCKPDIFEMTYEKV